MVRITYFTLAHLFHFDVAGDIYSDGGHMIVAGALAEKSFVIESLPVDSKLDCKDTDLVGLKPNLCRGKVQLRELTSDD